MIQIGVIQTLQIIKEEPFGAYLNTEDQKDDSVLLPKKQVPQGATIGSSVEVFVYRDSEDRLIATTKEPMITLGEMARLEVVSTTRIGAFLAWGLEKDLFLPFKEQKGTIKEGQNLLVALYVDKSNRLCATMKVYERLRTDHAFNVGDTVVGTLFEVHPEFGAFIAIENLYQGLIPKKDFFGKHALGDVLDLRVARLRPDGKVILCLRGLAPDMMDIDAELILSKIDENQGHLYLNDQSDPEVIRGYLHMSKKAFKRAVGQLLKAGKITFTADGMKRKED